MNWLHLHWALISGCLGALSVLVATLINLLQPYPEQEKWLHVIADVLSVVTQGGQGPKFPCTRSPRDGETHKIKLRMLPILFAWGGVLIGVSACCKGPQCRSLTSGIGACVLDPLPQAVSDLVPPVEAILSGNAIGWADQLKALESLGAGAVVCAVEKVLSNLHASLPPSSSHAEIDPRLALIEARCGAYLKVHGVKVAP